MNNTNNSNMLEIQSVYKRFGDVTAINNLSFTVKKGEVFGFLGPNGAGKTTTMRIITCLIPPSSGNVKVDGLDTRDNDLEIRRKIGYLPEANPLYEEMRIGEYLRFAGEINGLRGSNLQKQIDKMAEVCGIGKMINREIGKLSKGYRQRVGLAQTMLHDPDILILDEPMSGLDPNQIIEIRRLIKKLGEHKTVIYCSHILSEVSATCDRILIINNGASIAMGTSGELTSQFEKGNRYSMRIKAPAESIEPALSRLSNVSAVNVKEEQDGWNSVSVTSHGKDELGEELFKCTVSNNWSLSELKLESVSLEDVFTKLTRG